MHKDLGFNTEMILRLKLDGGSPIDISKILKERLLTNPNIVAVAGSGGSVMDFRAHGTEEIEVDGKMQLVDYRSIGIDEDFIDLFGLKLIRGEIDSPKDRRTCLINEKYFKYLGWDDYVGKKIGRFQYEVIGVVKDFNFDILHKDIGFLELQLGVSPDILNIKMNGNISENIAFIKKCFAEVEPYAEPDYAFYDDWIQSMYTKEESQAKAVRIFALFAIIISCLGLIGLIELTTNKKIKEIGIRKVNGAKVWEVMMMLNKDFVKWVALAFVVATPITWYAMDKWLQNFAYKTDLSWWIFAFAGLLALGIALLTVSWQSWLAATRNPVEALRYE
jgi:putative ABC transport system permease protein